MNKNMNNKMISALGVSPVTIPVEGRRASGEIPESFNLYGEQFLDSGAHRPAGIECTGTGNSINVTCRPFAVKLNDKGE
jgi:hypothetical protein